MMRLLRTGCALLLALAGAFLMAACSAAAKPAPASAPAPVQANALLGAADLAVGTNRFPFALLGSDGELLEGATVAVQFYRLKGDAAEPRGKAQAVFRQVQEATPHTHESGEVHQHMETRSIYVVDGVTFDQPGAWAAAMTIIQGGGNKPLGASIAFEVASRSSTPAVGAPAPASTTPTVKDVPDVTQICSRVPPDAMHEVSVAEALRARRPFVVVFATPAFCRSRLCGPVTDVVASLQPKYASRADFIHVEPYDLSKARSQGALEPVPAAREWGLPSEPWVFLVDAHGKVAAKFEGLVSPPEVEEAIIAMLGR